MSEKVSIKLPASLADYIRPNAPEEMKRQVLAGSVPASPAERVILLFFLCYDKDPLVRQPAQAAMKQLPAELVAEIAADPVTHPRLTELLQRFHPAVFAVSTPAEDNVPEATAESVAEPPEEAAADADVAEGDEQFADEADEEQEEQEESDEFEDEAFKSKYQLAQSMGVGDKIKMALTGDKEWRSLLVKDSNKLVNGAVVKNPRITEPEVLTICKSVVQNDEIIRIICQNKEWVKNYEIRKALVLNHKTPLPTALRFMGFLTEKDLGAMAKSKNISSVLSNQARRMLQNKQKKG